MNFQCQSRWRHRTSIRYFIFKAKRSPKTGVQKKSWPVTCPPKKKSNDLRLPRLFPKRSKRLGSTSKRRQDLSPKRGGKGRDEVDIHMINSLKRKTLVYIIAFWDTWVIFYRKRCTCFFLYVGVRWNIPSISIDSLSNSGLFLAPAVWLVTSPPKQGGDRFAEKSGPRFFRVTQTCGV